MSHEIWDNRPNLFFMQKTCGGGIIFVKKNDIILRSESPKKVITEKKTTGTN